MAVSDIIVSPASIWIAPVGEAEPDPNTVDLGANWGGNWENMGFTTAPISVSYSRDEFELFVQQLTAPVRRINTKEDFMIETTLAEQTANNMALVMNGTATTTAAAAGVVGNERVVAGGSPQIDQFTIGMEGTYQDDTNAKFPVRLVLFSVTVSLNGKLEFSKTEAAGIPMQARALADTNRVVGQQTFSWTKVTEAAL